MCKQLSVPEKFAAPAQVSERDWDIAMSVLSGESAKTVGERHGLDPLNTGKIANAVKRKIEEQWKKLLGF